MDKKMNVGRLLNLMLMLVMTASVANAKVVDREEAARVAAEFLHSTQPMMKASAVKMREVAPKVHGRRLAPANEDPAFYIFTPEEGCGFVIVSADDAAIPVLGYSDTGKIDEDNLPPALADMMEAWTKQINEVRSRGVEPDESVQRKWAIRKVSTPVMYLETALWNQYAPFNNQCPKINGEACVTGCVPAVYSILMRYYRYAKPVSATTTEYTCSTGAVVSSRTVTGDYDWSSMPLSYPYQGYGDKRDDAVAKLFADIGAFCKVDYRLNGTSAASYQPELLELFGYNRGERVMRSNYADGEWHAMLTQELDKRHPVLYDGIGSNGGHAFVIDGYTSDQYYHVNWGWGGSCNGYYSLNSMQPNEGGNYNNDQGAVLGIYPTEESDFEEPEYVAQIGSVYYEDINSAIEYAFYTGERVTLLGDAQMENLRIEKDQALDMDMNGHTLSLIGIGVYGPLTLNSSNGNGILDLSWANQSVIYVESTCRFESITINLGDKTPNHLQSRGVVDLYDCTFIYDDESIPMYASEGGVINIYGGKYKANKGFYAYEDSYINIYGGVFSAPITNFIAEGYVADANTDAETCEQYPYTVRKLGDVLPEGTAIASVNGQQFGSFTTAFDYAVTLTDAASIKLLDDVKINGLELSEGNIDLDINGHALTADYITNGAELTLRDSGKSGKIEILPNIHTPIYNTGTLTLEDVAIEGCPDGGYCLFRNNGIATIRGCSISGSPSATIIYNLNRMDIYETEITGRDEAWIAYANNESVLNIFSGRFCTEDYRFGLYAFNENSLINLYGGLFSFYPEEMYIADGCLVEDNTDPETCEQYTFIVAAIQTGISPIATESNATSLPLVYYTLDGKRISNPQPGSIVITRNSDGSVVKRIMK